MQFYFNKVLMLGDSITEGGWDQTYDFGVHAALAHYYGRRLEVVNRGFGGYNTENGRYILDKLIKEENAGQGKVVLMNIFFGTNDASSGIQKVPLDRFKENLSFLIEKAVAQGVKVIVTGTGPHDEVTRAANGNEQNRTTLRHREYSAAAQEVAQKHGVPFVELWEHMLESVGWAEGKPIPGKIYEDGSGKAITELLYDGIHYTGKAYKIWFEGLVKAIEQHYPELKPDNLPLVLPHWEDVMPREGYDYRDINEHMFE